ncbi:hypothetical protein Bbelb_002230 [Branchiostoma belcheri]|nr:hypothetical protein Bbelb_002230 [Branchiostoma belcheri]
MAYRLPDLDRLSVIKDVGIDQAFLGGCHMWSPAARRGFRRQRAACAVSSSDGSGEQVNGEVRGYVKTTRSSSLYTVPSAEQILSHLTSTFPQCLAGSIRANETFPSILVAAGSSQVSKGGSSVNLRVFLFRKKVFARYAWLTRRSSIPTTPGHGNGPQQGDGNHTQIQTVVPPTPSPNPIPLLHLSQELILINEQARTTSTLLPGECCETPVRVRTMLGSSKKAQELTKIAKTLYYTHGSPAMNMAPTFSMSRR